MMRRVEIDGKLLLIENGSNTTKDEIIKKMEDKGLAVVIPYERNKPAVLTKTGDATAKQIPLKSYSCESKKTELVYLEDAILEFADELYDLL